MTVEPFGSPGTPEAVWAAWPAPGRWPALEIDGHGRAVVASPHPDDETLAVGGTIAMLVHAGWDVDVVAITDGEASHPPTRARSAAALAAVRRAEQTAALDLLGVLCGRRHRLGLPDGDVAGHEDAVADRLAGLVPAGAWLLAPWDRDGHRDHDAVGRAARRAAHAVSARLLAYPVWAWHWAAPDHPALAGWRPLRVDLTVVARRTKARALDCYRSQTAALDDPTGADVVLPPSMLAHHRRPWEAVLA